MTQWQFVEQEKNELRSKNHFFLFFLVYFSSFTQKIALNRQSSEAKSERSNSNPNSSKRAGQTNANPSPTTGKGRSSSVKSNMISTGRPNTRKTIDTSKPHWILRVVSDADKAVRKIPISIVRKSVFT